MGAKQNQGSSCNHEELYARVDTVARSGMSRTLVFYAVRGGAIWDITAEIADRLGEKVDKQGRLRVRGGGMDMIFYTVYRLLRKEGCPEALAHAKYRMLD